MKALTIENNEAFLRQISKPVSFPSDTCLKEIETVRQYLRETSLCFAMASVQLGIPKRIIVIKSTSSDCKPAPESDWLVLLNPHILSQSGRTTFWEACKSCMQYTGLIERPYKMVLSYQDEEGKPHESNFEGFVCTVLSHELDHLDGIFHMDRAKQVRELTLQERIALRQLEPYTILSKDGDFHFPPPHSPELQ